jgi:hypothetical protein
VPDENVDDVVSTRTSGTGMCTVTVKDRRVALALVPVVLAVVVLRLLRLVVVEAA